MRKCELLPRRCDSLDIESTPITWTDVARSSIRQGQKAKSAESFLGLFAPTSVLAIGYWALPGSEVAGESSLFWQYFCHFVSLLLVSTF
jgi:hypothetical protein